MKRIHSKTAFLPAVLAAAGLLASGHAMAAVDMYLDMTGIAGESQSSTPPGQIDVLAWSWGASSGGARTTSGKLSVTCVQDISLTKYIDAATSALIMNSVTGTVAPRAVLTVKKAAGAEYLSLDMANVVVTSFSTGGSGGEDRLTENVTLRFATMTGTYTRVGAQPVKFTIGGGAGTAACQ